MTVSGPSTCLTSMVYMPPTTIGQPVPALVHSVANRHRYPYSDAMTAPTPCFTAKTALWAVISIYHFIEFSSGQHRSGFNGRLFLSLGWSFILATLGYAAVKNRSGFLWLFDIQMAYIESECDTVDAAKSNPISNWWLLTYFPLQLSNRAPPFRLTFWSSFAPSI